MRGDGRIGVGRLEGQTGGSGELAEQVWRDCGGQPAPGEPSAVGKGAAAQPPAGMGMVGGLPAPAFCTGGRC